MLRPGIKKVCVSGYPTKPNFSPPTLKIFKDFVGISLFGHIVYLLTHIKTYITLNFKSWDQGLNPFRGKNELILCGASLHRAFHYPSSIISI